MMVHIDFLMGVWWSNRETLSIWRVPGSRSLWFWQVLASGHQQSGNPGKGDCATKQSNRSNGSPHKMIDRIHHTQLPKLLEETGRKRHAGYKGNIRPYTKPSLLGRVGYYCDTFWYDWTLQTHVDSRSDFRRFFEGSGCQKPPKPPMDATNGAFRASRLERSVSGIATYIGAPGRTAVLLGARTLTTRNKKLVETTETQFPVLSRGTSPKWHILLQEEKEPEPGQYG